jgi:ubiquinone/menaquinone biosynthesis C-methylase UbiE
MMLKIASALDIVARDKVLDIATGYGEPAITAAKYVQPRGSVIATDISAQMLEIASDSNKTRISKCYKIEKAISNH